MLGTAEGSAVATGDAVGPGTPTTGCVDGGRRIMNPPRATAVTTAAPRASLGMVLMDGNLHGTRMARRCLIDGNAARTISSVGSGAVFGSPSSQSAMRGSKAARSWSFMLVAPAG